MLTALTSATLYLSALQVACTGLGANFDAGIIPFIPRFDDGVDRLWSYLAARGILQSCILIPDIVKPTIKYTSNERDVIKCEKRKENITKEISASVDGVSK